MDGVAVQEITASFSEQIQQCMAKHKLEKEELVRRFGNARDKWIGDNLEEWLAMPRQDETGASNVTRKAETFYPRKFGSFFSSENE